MSTKSNYRKQFDIDSTLRLRDILDTMAPFVKDFFRAVEPQTSVKTRISYAYDIRVFFNYLIERNPHFTKYTLKQFTLSDIEMVETYELEEYLEYLKVYRDSKDKQQVNTEKGLARKLSSLRSFYQYFYKRERIKKIPPP